MLIKYLLFVAAVLVAVVTHVAAQKSYSLQKITANQIYDNAASCTIKVQDQYQFQFNGGTFSRIAIPIRLDSVYTNKPSINNLQATSPQTTVTSASLLDPTSASDVGTIARFIIIDFNPVQGAVTFQISYTIDGALESDPHGNSNILRYSVKWPVVVNEIEITQTIPDTPTPSIQTSPAQYNSQKTTTSVVYKRVNLPANEVFLVATTLPMRANSCIRQAAIGGYNPHGGIPVGQIIGIIFGIIFLCFCCVFWSAFCYSCCCAPRTVYTTDGHTVVYDHGPTYIGAPYVAPVVVAPIYTDTVYHDTVYHDSYSGGGDTGYSGGGDSGGSGDAF